MRIEVLTSSASDVSDAAHELRKSLLDISDQPPSFVALHGACTYALSDLRDGLDLPAETALHGATSCTGVISHKEKTPQATEGVGLFALWEEDGDFGSAARALGDDPRGRALEATQAALEIADRAGETPDLIWLSVTPGQEESVLEGIQDAVGHEVPIVGGSAADNDISGQWAVFDRGQVLDEGLVVTVMFISGYQSDAFQSGYSPTTSKGRVTRAEGRRIFEINHLPAAEVYAHWTKGSIPAEIGSEPSRNILADSTLTPLSRQVQRDDGQIDYLLVHPAAINADGSIDVFAQVDEGEQLTLMDGTRDALIERAGQVAEMSRSSLSKGRVNAQGALVVFCGGCMMAVGDDIDQVADRIRGNLPDIPFLGIFTFGEQGHIPNGGNWHGNLMISCITFGS